MSQEFIGTLEAVERFHISYPRLAKLIASGAVPSAIDPHDARRRIIAVENLERYCERRKPSTVTLDKDTTNV